MKISKETLSIQVRILAFIRSLTGPGQKLTYQQLHKQLTDVIGVLDEKVEGVIERHELDFFAAYKVIHIYFSCDIQRHMHRVQKDLESLKKRLTEQEYLMRRSDKIAALEKEVAWYRDESLQQQKKMQMMKEEAQRMRVQTEDAQMQVAEMELLLAKQ